MSTCDWWSGRRRPGGEWADVKLALGATTERFMPSIDGASRLYWSPAVMQRWGALAEPFGRNRLLASSRRPQRLPVLLRPEIDLDVPDSGSLPGRSAVRRNTES